MPLAIKAVAVDYDKGDKEGDKNKSITMFSLIKWKGLSRSKVYHFFIILLNFVTRNPQPDSDFQLANYIDIDYIIFLYLSNYTWSGHIFQKAKMLPNLKSSCFAQNRISI